MAYTVTRTEAPMRRLIHLVALLPIVAPPFVLALAIILLFGRSGLISHGLFGLRGANVYGFQSLVLIQTLSFSSIAYLNIRGMLMTMDSSLEDASRSLGASSWRTFRKVTLALSAPAVVTSFILVFVRSLEDFGNPMLIGGSYTTLAVEAFTQITAMFNLSAGAVLALTLLVPSMLAFLIQHYWTRRRSYVTVTGKPGREAVRIDHPLVVGVLTVLCGIVVFGTLLLYGTVFAISFMRTVGADSSFTLEHYAYIFSSGFRSMANSIELALVATPITAFGGILIANLLNGRPLPGADALRWLTRLAFAAPGTIVGIGFILAFNAPPLELTGTALIIVAAMCIRNVQVGIDAGENQLRQVDPAIEEASLALGASRWRTFWKVGFPLMLPAMFTALAYAFTRSLITLSAVIFLVSADWTLVTVTILGQIQSSALSTAAAYCVLLVVVVLGALGLMSAGLRLIGGKGGRL
jgi:iron(III) transport system permease protein